MQEKFDLANKLSVQMVSRRGQYQIKYAVWCSECGSGKMSPSLISDHERNTVWLFFKKKKKKIDRAHDVIRTMWDRQALIEARLGVNGVGAEYGRHAMFWMRDNPGWQSVGLLNPSPSPLEIFYCYLYFWLSGWQTDLTAGKRLSSLSAVVWNKLSAW